MLAANMKCNVLSSLYEYKIAYLVVSLETPTETNYHQSLRTKVMCMLDR